MGEEQNGVRILWAEELTYPKGWSMISHEHPFYHLFYCKESACTFLVDEKVLPLAEGDCIIVPPHCMHGIAEPMKKKATIDEVMFRVKDGHLAGSLEKLGVRTTADDIAKYLLDFLVQYGVSRLEYMQTYAAHNLYALLSYFCMPVEDTSVITLNRQQINMTGFTPLSAGIVVYIDAHYMEPVSLADIAASVGYNSSYICTVFKKDSGITINDYLNFVRIKRAAEYLSYTNCDISYICALSGFQNLSHFIRTFHKFLGVPPGYYKRMAPVNINDKVLEKFSEHVLGSELAAIAERLGTFQSLPEATSGLHEQMKN